MKRIIIDIEDKIHQEFKIYCCSIDKTIKQVVTELIKVEMKKKGGNKIK